jgi:hypothetical protein
MDAVPELSPPENAPPKAVAERPSEICRKEVETPSPPISSRDFREQLFDSRRALFTTRYATQMKNTENRNDSTKPTEEISV